MAAPKLEGVMRHTLVWVRPEADWRALEPDSWDRLSSWFGKGWPAVFARLQGDEPPGYWRLGVPLPPAEGKRRLGVTAPVSAMSRWRAPLPLCEVLAAAPGSWRQALEDLLIRAGTLGLQPHVYGSFAWQALTGLPYVTDRSDIDLAWQPCDCDEANALMSLLKSWEAETGRRADGELLLTSGEGVCWRELASGASRVLVKGTSTVALRYREDILDSFSNHRTRVA
jgi:phosphoribosyl-dephospho-CoA transferase